MKSLNDFLTEAKQVRLNESYEEFKKDAVGYIKHANKAAAKDEYGPKGEAEKSWEASRQHMNNIRNAYGDKVAQAVSDHVHSANDHQAIKKIFDEMCNKGSKMVTEGADIAVRLAPDGTRYVVHMIHPKSGIDSDQLRVGEHITDTELDDLKDAGYNVHVHGE